MKDFVYYLHNQEELRQLLIQKIHKEGLGNIPFANKFNIKSYLITRFVVKKKPISQATVIKLMDLVRE